jgi:glucokinase
MTNLRTIDATQMRRINRSSMLEFIRQNSPTSRTAIAKALDISLPTVLRILEELFERNLVYEDGFGDNKTGRRRTMIHFNDLAYSIISVDVGGTKIYASLADISGRILSERIINQHQSQGEACFEMVCDMISELKSHAPEEVPVRGISVALPGITDAEKGIVEYAPSIQWRNYPLKSKLEERFKIPAFANNDVNLACLGEFWFGAGRDIDNMMLLSIGTGIGSGLVLNGQLHLGTSGAAGEVGFFTVSVDDLGKQYEHYGSFESKASGLGLFNRGQICLKKIQNDPPKIHAKEIFELADQGVSWAEEIIVETLDYISMAIANSNTLLDLDMIVLTGGVSRSLEKYIPEIHQRIEGVIPRIPVIKMTELKSRATVMGSIIRILHSIDGYLMFTGK